MRIAYVLAQYPVLSQTFVHAELCALRARGLDVAVVAHERGPDGLRFGDGPDSAPFPVVHHDLRSPRTASVLAGFDHLHGHFADFGLRTLAPLAAAAERPFSVTAHAYDLFRHDACVSPAELAALPPACRRIVTISRFHRDFLVDRGVPAARVAVIPNAARLASLLAGAPAAPTRLRRMLAVGRPIPKKGFAHLIHAWARIAGACPGLELTILGGEGMVAEPPPGLHLRPMVPYAEVLDEMARADLIVAPCVISPDGDMDGVPTVLAEAGALRRPVLATTLSGIGDLVVSGVNGLLVPPGDEDALAAAIVRLYRRPAELQLLASGGPVLAASHDATVVASALHQEVFAA